MLNSRPHDPDGNSGTDICADGVGHVLHGLVADELDIREAAACTQRRLELQAARAELELRREASREPVLRHKVWRQNCTLALMAVLMSVIAVRSDLASPALFSLLVLSSLVTRAVFGISERWPSKSQSCRNGALG